MAFPKLTKQEALRLECVRVSHDADNARALYEFIVEKPVAAKRQFAESKSNLNNLQYSK